jgi:hypothetical protein
MSVTLGGIVINSRLYLSKRNEDRNVIDELRLSDESRAQPENAEVSMKVKLPGFVSGFESNEHETKQESPIGCSEDPNMILRCWEQR